MRQETNMRRKHYTSSLFILLLWALVLAAPAA